MKQVKQVTIYDVAKMAGVSSATVSRVLNEPDKVNPEKRQKVLDAVNELRFVPKADAVANARKLYKKIGIVAPFFTQPSFMERLRGATDVLAKEHYEVVIYSIDSKEDLNNYISSLVTMKRVDGLIFLCVQVDDEMKSLLEQASFPVCFVENEVSGFDGIVINNYEGGKKAAEYLFNKGCRNPGFIGEKSLFSYAVNSTEERLDGYKRFFETKGIEIKDENIWVGEFSENSLDAGIKNYLNRKKLPDCVFCSSDMIGAKFIHYALVNGIEIPEKIKVLGFDDIDIAEYISLSSVNQSLDESGRQAAEQILERIRNPEKAVVTIGLQLEIIERITTK